MVVLFRSFTCQKVALPLRDTPSLFQLPIISRHPCMRAGKASLWRRPAASSFKDPETPFITSLLRFSFDMASCGMSRFVLLAAGTSYSD